MIITTKQEAQRGVQGVIIASKEARLCEECHLKECCPGDGDHHTKKAFGVEFCIGTGGMGIDAVFLVNPDSSLTSSCTRQCIWAQLAEEE